MAAVPTPELEDLLDLSLGCALTLLRAGADTGRVLSIMNRVARAGGAARCEGAVSSTTVSLCVWRDGRMATALRKAPHIGVDLAVLASVESAVQAFESGPQDLTGLRRALAGFEQAGPTYAPSLRIAGIAVAGGCFAAMFSGDAWAILGSAVGSGLGLAVRLRILASHFQPFIATLSAAAVATGCAALAASASATPEAAVSAAVLFLVPGVPLVNGTTDLLSGHPLNGLVRLATAGVVLLAMVLGMGLAVHATGTGVHP